MSASDRLPSAPNPGRLYLVPTPLDFGCDAQTAIADVLPRHTIETAARLPSWICERAKSVRAFLRRVGEQAPLAQPLPAIRVTEIDHHLHKKGDLGVTVPHAVARELLGDALAGADMGLASEAGMPALADPGGAVVHAAHQLGIPVVPLVGPVSIALALGASGLNCQNFAFVGYLPRALEARVARIGALEQLARRTAQSQLFIETPYRNRALLATLLQTLQPDTRLCVALGLTLPDSEVRSATVAAWRKRAPLAQLELPTVFALGR